MSKAREFRHELRDILNQYVDYVWPLRQATELAFEGRPGEQWTTEEQRERIFAAMFGDQDIASWRRAVEFMPYGGLYTEKLLARSPCEIRAYDFSERFIAVLHARCEQAVAKGRLSCHLIEWKTNDAFLKDLDKAGWLRTVDAFYAVDVLVRMDLEAVIVFLLTAALSLRPDGKLLAAFANPLSESGLRILFENIQRLPAFHSPPSFKLRWITDDTVRAIATRLGFRVDSILDGPSHDLDVARSYVTATLVDTAPAEAVLDKIERGLYPTSREMWPEKPAE